MEAKSKVIVIISTIILIICVVLIAYITIMDNINNQKSSFKEEIASLESNENAVDSAHDEEVSDSNPDDESREYTASDNKTYKIVAILKIPSLEIEYPVFSTTSEELLKVSLNKYWGPVPNQEGNFCILGHNYYNGKFFSNLPNIQEGAKVYLKDMKGKQKVYTVYYTDIVNPNDTSCTSQLTNGQTELTLITCCNGSTKRFIAKAVAD